MSNSTPKNKLSTEELLELLNNTNSENAAASVENKAEVTNEVTKGLDREFEFESDIANFIIKTNIQPGEHKVLCKKIYRYYKAWSYRPVDYLTFKLCFPELYPNIESIKDANLVYSINKNGFEILQHIETLEKTKTKGNSKSASQLKSSLAAFNQFKLDCKIAKGKTLYPFILVYTIYTTWWHNKYSIRKRGKLGKKAFLAFMKLHVNIKRTTLPISTCFYLDDSILTNITKKQLSQLIDLSKTYKYKDNIIKLTDLPT